MSTDGKLAGKIAVVTGARGGIGSAICSAFVREGATVIAGDLDGIGQVEAEGLHHRVVDVASESSVQALRDDVEREWGRVDVLVNNAGLMLGKPLFQTTDDELDRLMAVNVKGPLAMMRALVPLMPGKGSVVNMSSAAASKPLLNMSAYSASKAALSVLSKVAAAEVAPVRVNSVQPGTIDTPMPRAFLSKLRSDEQERELERLRLGRFVKRLGKADEVAAMVLYLASDDSSFVTGADFVIDGGRF